MIAKKGGGRCFSGGIAMYKAPGDADGLSRVVIHSWCKE